MIAGTCPGCRAALPAAARFCPGCGLAQPLSCPRCGASNPPQHRFCAACGNGLRDEPPPPFAADVPPAPSPPASAVRNGHAERRQLTVLFCDLADSTAMASSIDPEDFREIVDAYHHASVRVVQGYGGHVAQYLGDGVLAYFGWPRALENAAARALHAACGIVAALPALNERLRLPAGRRLRVRIGVHSGTVVVGDVGAGGRLEHLAIGDVPNVAARLQSAAAPDSVVASVAVRHLVREPMAWRDLGLLALKGVAQPVQAFAVESDAPGAAAEPAPAEEAVPMVGRSSEAAFIDVAWEGARGGAGAVVLLSGEAGIGKSRLLAHARRRARDGGGRVAVLRCSPYHSASELHPLIEWLEQELGFARTDSPAERSRRLATALAADGDGGPGEGRGDGDDPLQRVALLAGLLSLPLPEGVPPPRLTPQAARQRTRQTLLRRLLSQARAQPLLVAFEDLHWADPSTLEFLHGFTGAIAALPVLLVATFRPEFVPPWPGAPRMMRLELERLSQPGIEAIVSRLAGDRPLPEAVLQRIVANTDGIPLFVEEFTRAVLESGLLRERDGAWALEGEPRQHLIPESLRDSLASRLDRLGDGRVVARHAAVLGRRFDAALVAALAGLTPEQVRSGLDELANAALVYPVESTDGVRYEFKHALVQVAAYESLLRRERVALHGRAAQEIAARQPELAERQPELLAFHLTESQQWVPAAQRWLLAGQRALARSACAEAAAHLRAGLALVPHLPDGGREELELALLSTIGPALIATTGFGSPQVGEVYARARQLCELMQGRQEFFPALWGSWVFHLVSGQLAVARGIAEQMLALGQRHGDAAMLVEAHWTLGDALFWSGELARADDELARSTAVYDEAAHAAHALRYGQDPLVAAECYRSYALWALGRPDAALQALARARQAAAQRDHIFTTGWVLAFEFMAHLFRREPQPALAAAERALAFSGEHNHPFWSASAMIVRGWAMASLGDRAGGVAVLREGLAAYVTTGSRVVEPLWHALLAELELQDGRLEPARAALDTGLARAQAVGERISEIELWRVSAGWHAARGDPAEARRCLTRALALAGQCGARAFALRAATDWHRWFAALPGGAADSPLPALLASFAEGADTADVRQARAALQEHSG